MNSSPFVIVTGDFVPTGGMDRANLALAQYLFSQPGIASSLHLVAHRLEPSLLRQPGIHFHKVPKILKSYWLSGPLLDLSGRIQARKYHPFVVVNGGNCRTPFATANWVHYVHAHWSPGQNQGVPLNWFRKVKNNLAHRDFLRHERIALQRCRIIIANSHLTARHLVNHYQIDPARIHVVYYGTDQDLLSPVTDAQRISARESLGLGGSTPAVFFVGALGDSRKGFDILYQAWSTLCQKNNWDAHLFVVGSGASLPYYQQKTMGDKLNRNITFLGFRHDVPHLLGAADLLVSPTRYEAYGLNVHEALCRNIPVLVSSTAGIAERFAAINTDSNKISMTFDISHSHESLTSALLSWRQNQAACKSLASAVGATLRDKSWSDRMAELVHLLLDAV